MQHAKGEERREFQRLHLETPIAGTFGSHPVTILEIGVLGARLHHDEPLGVERGELQFTYEEHNITMKCEVARLVDEHTAGLRFRAALGESGDHLRVMLAELVTRALEEHHDSSATKIRLRVIDGDKTVRGRDANFLAYRLESSGWKKRYVFLPEQPSIGFTVARGEDPEEMQRLCEVYEASDDEGRRLIRLFAELSISDALQIPPRH